jgi:hypothetical protein
VLPITMDGRRPTEIHSMMPLRIVKHAWPWMLSLHGALKPWNDALEPGEVFYTLRSE